VQEGVRVAAIRTTHVAEAGLERLQYSGQLRVSHRYLSLLVFAVLGPALPQVAEQTVVHRASGELQLEAAVLELAEE